MRKCHHKGGDNDIFFFSADAAHYVQFCGGYAEHMMISVAIRWRVLMVHMVMGRAMQTTKEGIDAVVADVVADVIAVVVDMVFGVVNDND